MTLHVVSNFSLRALHVLRITCMYIYQECHSLSQTFPFRNLVVITHHILKSENFQNHANKSAKIFFNFPGYTNSSKEFLQSNHYSLFLAYWLLSSKYPSKTVLREFPKPVSLWHYTSCFNLVHKFYALKMPHIRLFLVALRVEFVCIKFLKSSLPSRHNDNIRLCLALTKWSKTLSRSPLWYSLSLSLPCVYMHHQHHVK